MKALPQGVDEGELVDALADSWRLEVESLSYMAVGFGSYHWLVQVRDGHRYFLTLDDLDHKPWLGADRQAVFDGLGSAFETARALNEDAGLDFVVAPIVSVGGEFARRFKPRYCVALYPLVAGRPGDVGKEVSPSDRNEVLRMLAALHRATPAVQSLAPHRGLDTAGRPEVESALGEADRTWTGGPYSEPARVWLSAVAGTVRRAVHTFDRLADEVASSKREPVITHGEPHAGNLIRTTDRLFLVDWDTVALAPPERDLWMLDDGTEDGLTAYTEATGIEVDRVALAYYRLSWTVEDIGAFLTVFRSPHRESEDTEKAWTGLKSTISTLDAVLS